MTAYERCIEAQNKKINEIRNILDIKRIDTSILNFEVSDSLSLNLRISSSINMSNANIVTRVLFYSRQTSIGPLKLEEVLEICEPEIAKKIIFNLDLFV